jgi:hypothetical protein
MICISLKTKANYDDTSLYLVVDNEYEAANQLNKDIYVFCLQTRPF